MLKDRMIGLLPTYLQCGANINIYYKVLSGFLQELYDLFQQIDLYRDIDNSVEYALDIIGDIVGELRQGRNDVDYKVALRGRIISNRSTGDIETINNFSRTLLGDYFVGVFESPTPMNLKLRYTFNPLGDKNTLINLVKKAVAAGVNLDTNLQIQVPVCGTFKLGAQNFTTIEAVIE